MGALAHAGDHEMTGALAHRPEAARIGLSKSKWMAAEHGHGLRLLQAVKDALDPQHLLNPGKLGLRPPTGGRS